MAATSSTNRFSPGRIAMFAGLVLVVGAVGVLLGTWTRHTIGPPSPEAPLIRPGEPLLRPGMTLPEVTVRLPGGAPETLQAVLDDRGIVVVFLDLECPPCEDMALAWRYALETAGDVRVIGITNQAEDAIEGFVDDNEIPFPIYQDVDRVFLDRYDVSRFPMEWVVDAGGNIRSQRYETGDDIDLDAIRRLLGES